MTITSTKEELINKRGYPKNIRGRQYDLYLSNYPITAKYLANRIGDKSKVLVELCSGIGITLCELVPRFKKVIAVELDKVAIEYCKQNLKDAGINKIVTLVQGDVSDLKILKDIKADVVIYDTPYWVSKKLPDGTDILEKNPDLTEMMKLINKYISKNIILSVPRWFTYKSANKFGLCEFQKIIINGKHDRNYIYYGDCLRKEGITVKNLS